MIDRSLSDLFDGPAVAFISECETYRRALSRPCGGDLPLVGIGLNPSVATAEIDDPTILKDMKFTKAWGFGRFIKLNASDYRATDPADMKAARKRGVVTNSIENDRVILWVVDEARRRGGKVWVSWGNHISPARQAELATELGDDLWCIKTNKNGTPIHELYQPDASVLQRWRCP